MAVACASYSETLEFVFTHSACWRTAAHDADVDMHARTASDKVTHYLCRMLKGLCTHVLCASCTDRSDRSAFVSVSVSYGH